MQTMCVRRPVLNISFAVQRIVASCIVAVSDVGGNSPMMPGPAEGCAQIMDMVSMSNLCFWVEIDAQQKPHNRWDCQGGPPGRGLIR